MAESLTEKRNVRLDRVKYDSRLLTHQLFDGPTNNINSVAVCRTKVKRAVGNVLSHYFARVDVAGKQFEFHPGSQPYTFQNLHGVDDGDLPPTVVQCDIMCNECTKRRLHDMVNMENQFNLMTRNCETIMCERTSFQSVLVSAAVIAAAANLIYFSWYLVLFIVLLLIVLYLNNNHPLANPRVKLCEHIGGRGLNK